MDRTSDQFVTLLTASQPSLYACIFALLPERAAARDILQETNLTLWHKADDFEPETNFLASAWFSTRSFSRNSRSGRRRVSRNSMRAAALQACLAKLPEAQRELVERRYAPGGSVQRIAERDGKSVGAISQTLYRLREALLNCVQQTLAGEGSV